MSKMLRFRFLWESPDVVTQMLLNFCDKFLYFSYFFKLGLEDLHDSYFDIFVSRVWGLPRCKNLTRFSLFVSFCFAVRYCLKCFCFLCFTSSVSFTGSYTEVKPASDISRSFHQFCFLYHCSGFSLEDVFKNDD